LITLIPFLIGMGVSIARSDDIAYFGTAINIGGSQRMRTMLISDYSQKIFYEDDIDKQNQYLDILTSELSIYKDYRDSLIYGDTKLELGVNKYS